MKMLRIDNHLTNRQLGSLAKLFLIVGLTIPVVGQSQEELDNTIVTGERSALDFSLPPLPTPHSWVNCGAARNASASLEFRTAIIHSDWWIWGT